MTERPVDGTEALVREYYDAWDAGDPARVEACFGVDFSTTYTDEQGETVRVEAGDVHGWITGWLDIVADMDHEIHSLVADGDQVMTRITYRGTHVGEVFGVEPTGTRVEVEEFHRFRIRDGRIVELDWLSDDLSFRRQLGLELPVDR